MNYSLKTISIGSSGGDLAFEGLGGSSFQASHTFCHKFMGVNPQSPDHRGFSGIFLRYRLSRTAHAPFIIEAMIRDNSLAYAYLAHTEDHLRTIALKVKNYVWNFHMLVA